MDPLSITASIIAILQLTSTALSLLSKLKNVSTEQRQYTIEMSNLYGLLSSLRLRLEGGMFDDPWYEAVKTLGTQNGPLDQYKNALEEFRDKILPSSGLATLGKVLVRQNDTKSVLTRIERLKSLIQIALEMDHFKLSHALNSRIEALHRENEAIKDDTTKIRKSIDDNTLNERIEWLSSSVYPSQQSDIIAQRQDGTGEWFLNSPEFKTWTDCPGKTLFCPGVPGAGKTMILSIAIDHLLKTPYSTDVGVAYIYFNYKACQDQTAAALLAAILKQLIQPRPLIGQFFRELFNRHAERQTKPSLEEIRDALKIAVTGLSSVFVLVDALDECQDYTRRQFLAELRGLRTRTDLRLMCTARSIPEVEDEIENEFAGALKLEVRAASEDMKNFVNSRIERLPKCVRDDSALQKLVLDKISEAADGIFLLARLFADSLQDKYTPKNVKNALEEFGRWSKTSKSIEQAYDVAYGETLKRIEGQSQGAQKLAKNVLSWMIYAKRHLTITELCHALAVETRETELNQENIPLIEDLVSMCAGLVVVDKNNRKVRLVHHTIQEYLERTQEKWIPGAQTYTASICLVFLSFIRKNHESQQVFRINPFLDYAPQFGGQHTSTVQEVFKTEPFLDYAVQFWGQHTLPVQEDVDELAYMMLKSENLKLCAAPLTSKLLETPDFTFRDPASVTSLHVTAYYGLSSLLTELLHDLGASASDQIDYKDSRGQTPLFWAAHGGQISTTRLLLTQSDIDTKMRDKNGRTALSIAAQEGNAAVVKELMVHSPQLLDIPDVYGRTALSLAAEMNRIEAIQLLLDHGADISTIDDQRKGVLHYAVSSLQCSTSLVQVLLRQGAPFEEPDVENMTPLHIAVKFSMKEVVKTLLESQVPVDLKVCRRAYVRRAKLQGNLNSSLYDQQSALNITNEGGGLTPLHYASLVGNKKMTEFLLEMNADPNVLSEHDETPLKFARTQTIEMPYYTDDWTDDHLRAERLLPFLDAKGGDDVEGVLDAITISRCGVLRALLDSPWIHITEKERIDGEMAQKDYAQRGQLDQIASFDVEPLQDVFSEWSDDD